MVEQYAQVEYERTPEPQSGDAKVFVNYQDEEPDTDDDTLLKQKEHVVGADQQIHQGVALAAAHFQPAQGKEGVEDIEQQNRNREQEVLSGVRVDVDVVALSDTPPTFSLVEAQQRIPDSSRRPASFGTLSPITDAVHFAYQIPARLLDAHAVCIGITESDLEPSGE